MNTPITDSSQASAYIKRAEILSDADKRELQQFIVLEEQRGALREKIDFITNKCFNKCVTGQISAGAGKLDRTERSCMENCANRFVDVGGMLFKHIEKLQQGL